MGNHNWMYHGKHIYNEQIHVPLIFSFSANSSVETSIDYTVELVDIAPTVLELAGVPLQKLQKQPKPIQGISLVPLFQKGGRDFPEKYAFAQRRHYNPTQNEGKDYEAGEKYTLQGKTHKYIYRTQGEPEFFDLEKDPYEVNCLTGNNSEEERKLRNKLLNKIRKFKQNKSGKPESINKEAIEKLKSLGYVQ